MSLQKVVVRPRARGHVPEASEAGSGVLAGIYPS